MAEVVLSIEALRAGYGGIPALHGVDLEVREGQIVALLGANGAGKSTLLRCISGMIGALSGRIRFVGEDITRRPAHLRPAKGLIHVPEGRRIFGGMSIEDNLFLGAFGLSDVGERARRLERVYALFPVLARRRHGDASYLSGGEQQMLAIGRALMAAPRVLLLDEPSMGLAPLLVKEIMRIIERLNAEGTTILLVEQNSKAALKLADFGYVMGGGRVLLADTATNLSRDDAVARIYLGGDTM